MKQNIVKELSTKELSTKLSEEETMYRKMRLNHAVSPIENPMKIRHSRRAIARLKTELQKRLSENK